MEHRELLKKIVICGKSVTTKDFEKCTIVDSFLSKLERATDEIVGVDRLLHRRYYSSVGTPFVFQDL